TDFLNMLNRTRLASKKTSKTEAVQSVAGERLADENIHIGPSDYVPWQLDNKIAFIRVEGRLFGDVPMEIDVKLSVEDSPNAAAASGRISSSSRAGGSRSSRRHSISSSSAE